MFLLTWLGTRAYGRHVQDRIDQNRRDRADLGAALIADLRSRTTTEEDVSGDPAAA